MEKSLASPRSFLPYVAEIPRSTPLVHAQENEEVDRCCGGLVERLGPDLFGDTEPGIGLRIDPSVLDVPVGTNSNDNVPVFGRGGVDVAPRCPFH